jgi:hypothetical protein
MLTPRLGRTFRLGLLAAALALPSAGRAAEPPSPVRAESASADARKLVAWAVDTGDHQGGPFLVVDKVEAKVFAFSAEGVLLGAAPALLGLGRGDISPAGIGTRKLSSILPAERITPAGRFVAAIGRNIAGKDILWIDYDAAVSLHRVDTAKPRERRLQRLATPTASDNRISYGCVNVPAAFYETIVAPLFKGRTGIVYILPETQTAQGVFFTTWAGLDTFQN